jgi:hypothetical protein
VRDERAIAAVPAPARALLALALALQLAWQVWQPPAPMRPQDLPAPPDLDALRLISLGEPVALAKGLLIYLQSFDSQRGQVIALRRLDYDRVQAWLNASLALDPLSQYPLLLASRVYGELPGDEVRQRQMLSFVRQQFDADPNQRWPWLAHAVVIARHRLKDMPLAREYAAALRLKATGDKVPSWVGQMEILLLQDMNELETARILLGGLIHSGQVKEERELNFLKERLAEIEVGLGKPAGAADKP